MTFGQKLKQTREKHGWTQIEFQKKSGIKREYLSRIENGHLDNPTLRLIRDCGIVFGLTPSEMLQGVE